MNKKNKKMTLILIISIYLGLSLIIYLLVGGFYFTRKYIDQDLKANNMSVDQLDSSKDKIRIGIFAGMVDFKNQKNYLFQFSDVFEDKTRMLNIYFPVDNGNAYFIETDDKISGTEALFVIQKGGINSDDVKVEENPKAKVFNAYYAGTKLPEPETFLKKTETITTFGDSLFVLSLNINANRFQVKMLNFIKNNYGFYGLIRKKADSDKKEWQLKDTSVNKDKVKKGIFRHILIAAVDIITAIVQLVALILYGIFWLFQFIYLLLTKGPVK